MASNSSLQLSSAGKAIRTPKSRRGRCSASSRSGVLSSSAVCFSDSVENSSQSVVASMLSQEVEIVLTAHPTQVNRRTLQYKHIRLAHLLDYKDRQDLGLTIVEQSLWKVVPHYFRRVSNALRKHTGRPLPLTCTPMKFGSWMGGDRDGNPNVTAKVTRDVSLLSGWMVVDLYIREIDSLRFELSMNQCSDSLLRMAHEILLKENSSEDWEESQNQLKHHGQHAASLPEQLPAGADLPSCTECSGGEYSRLEIPSPSWNQKKSAGGVLLPKSMVKFNR